MIETKETTVSLSEMVLYNGDDMAVRVRGCEGNEVFGIGRYYYYEGIFVARRKDATGRWIWDDKECYYRDSEVGGYLETKWHHYPASYVVILEDETHILLDFSSREHDWGGWGKCQLLIPKVRVDKTK